MIFAEEDFKDVYAELMPLLEEHYLEIAHYQDIKLNVNKHKYCVLTENGTYVLFTARDPVTRRLTGYQGFMMAYNIHYMDSLQASEDVLFVSKERRGFGRKFIRWVDDRLREKGVQAVFRHVKQAHNHGPLLERAGYENIDLIFGKRLDK